MKKNIRLTESDLRRIVNESVYKILQEDGLGGTSCAGVYDTPSSTGAFEGGKAQSKEVTDYPFGGIITQGHNLGKRTKKKEKGIDMTPATDRSGGKNHSIAINYVGESIIREAVDEGIGNFLKTAALGGMMAMSPMQANAQTQNYQQQQPTTQQSQQNKPVHQRGTYWDLADNADDITPLQKVTKQDITPVMQNIIAVTKNLTNWLETINKSLLKVSPEQKRETENAILTHCVKNKQTGKLVNANDFTLNDASYVKRIYDAGDNLVSININGSNYFITVAALNKAMQFMGMQAGGSSLIRTFIYHK
jgi:hypothetical protein